jgi:hypothetical protein
MALVQTNLVGTGLGPIPEAWYWTSTQNGPAYAVIRRLSGSYTNESYDNKSYPFHYFLVVRAF